MLWRGLVVEYVSFVLRRHVSVRLPTFSSPLFTWVIRVIKVEQNHAIKILNIYCWWLRICYLGLLYTWLTNVTKYCFLSTVTKYFDAFQICVCVCACVRARMCVCSCKQQHCNSPSITWYELLRRVQDSTLQHTSVVCFACISCLSDSRCLLFVSEGTPKYFFVVVFSRWNFFLGNY
jgi:hypothetical protein